MVGLIARLWTSGRFPGKVALRFRGPDSGDKVQLLAHDRFNCTAAFSVAVWFKVEQVAARDQALVAKGEDSWWLQQHVNTNRLAFNTNHDVPDVLHPRLIDRTIGHTDIVDGRWHLAAAVYEPVGKTAHKLLYIDGRVDAENEATAPLHKNSKPVWLAQWHGDNLPVPGANRRGGDLRPGDVGRGGRGHVPGRQSRRVAGEKCASRSTR